jgi:trk system potassium uptake protein TrkH
MATGGFSNRNASIGAYNSPAIEWICIVFMFLAATNFTLIYRFLQGRIRDIVNNSEFKAYCLIIAVIAGGCAFVLFPEMGKAGLSGLEAAVTSIRQGLFHTLTVISSTGLTVADHRLWPPLAQGLLFILMFIGGCSGSTAGGIKVIRHLVLAKQTKNEMMRLMYPRGVFSIQLDKKVGRKDVVYGVAGFVFLYVVLILLTTILVCAGGVDLNNSFNLSILSLGNIGLGFGSTNVDVIVRDLPGYTKVFLCLIMITGRLELWTVFAFFSRGFRRR